MDLEAIKKIAFEHMGNKRSHSWKEKGNKYFHGERVGKLVITLRKYILPNDTTHDDILTVAAWLHDISNGTAEHERKGADKARKLIAPYCSAYELEEIYKIILCHDDRNGDRSSFSDYSKLHQDADLLDHFGTFDIWTIFLYAAHHNQTMSDVEDWLTNTRPKENQRYLTELNFDISKTIFHEKSEFINSFAQRLNAENSGDIWNEEELLK